MGPGMMSQGGMWPWMMGSGGFGPAMCAAMAGHVDGRLAYLKAELKITEAQEPLWKAYAAAAPRRCDRHARPLHDDDKSRRAQRASACPIAWTSTSSSWRRSSTPCGR